MAADARPTKRTKLLQDSDGSGDESDSSSSGAGLKINPEYARRFEHNKKREEKDRLEEKYGKTALSDSSSSESEDEDDAGDLADEDNDAQFQTMIQALKSKDPRIYEEGVRFFDDGSTPPTGSSRKPSDKPIRLQDYHRKNLLNSGATGEEEEEGANDASKVKTYGEEQADLKRDLLRQADDDSESDGDSDDGNQDFLKPKPKPKPRGDGDSKAEASLSTADVETADADPEAFLSKFMSSRAWVPTETSNFQAFESEDDEYDDMADRYEDAYNMRYEDPEKANETIKTHSRDAASQYSVRREDLTGRKKARATQRTAEKSAKDERAAEKERLRRLKVEEAQQKLQQFKEAAGLRGKDIAVEDWSRFLEAGFDDDNWDSEMRARFGDDYYEARDAGSPSEASDMSDSHAQESTSKKQKKKKKPKMKKPEWDTDIDIGDIVPNFDAEEERTRAQITLTDDEDNDNDTDANEIPADNATKTKKNKKEKIRQASDRKRTARLERQQIEDLVDRKLATDSALADNEESVGPFKYRDTSPTSFGLSAQEILMADDSQLNQYAGLKKLAAFRDAMKKKKDKKYYSKKARLRQWRQETFGDDSGPQKESYAEFVRKKAGLDGAGRGKRRHQHVEEDTGPSKKRRRAKKRAIAAGEM